MTERAGCLRFKRPFGADTASIERSTSILLLSYSLTSVSRLSIRAGACHMSTPLGFWKVEEKKKMGRSRKYGDAPMPELFEVDNALQSLIDRGVAPDPRGFEGEYRSTIAAVLEEAKLEVPADQRPILGGRRGHHSEHLGHLLAVMSFSTVRCSRSAAFGTPATSRRTQRTNRRRRASVSTWSNRSIGSASRCAPRY